MRRSRSVFLVLFVCGCAVVVEKGHKAASHAAAPVVLLLPGAGGGINGRC